MMEEIVLNLCALSILGTGISHRLPSVDGAVVRVEQSRVIDGLEQRGHYI